MCGDGGGGEGGGGKVGGGGGGGGVCVCVWRGVPSARGIAEMAAFVVVAVMVV